MEKDVPEIFARCQKLIAERRENPTDDLTSVLVHAEVDGRETRGARDRDGLLPARRRRQRRDQGDVLQRHARADGRPRAAAAAARRPLAGAGAVEEALRMFPAFAHFRRTATATPSCTASRSGRARRSSCGTSPRTATRRATRTRIASTCTRTPSTRRSAPAAGTSASAPRSRAWSCGS